MATPPPRNLATSSIGKRCCKLYGHSRTGKLNSAYFGPQKAKKGPEFWPTQRAAIRLDIATHLVRLVLYWLRWSTRSMAISGVNPNLFFFLGGGGEILPGSFRIQIKKILSPRYFYWGRGRDRPLPGMDATDGNTFSQLLHEDHRLMVPERIKFRLVVLVFKSLNNTPFTRWSWLDELARRALVERSWSARRAGLTSAFKHVWKLEHSWS